MYTDLQSTSGLIYPNSVSQSFISPNLSFGLNLSSLSFRLFVDCCNDNNSPYLGFSSLSCKYLFPPVLNINSVRSRCMNSPFSY